MNLPTFYWLLSPPGQALLASIAPAELGENAQLATLTRLRKHASVEQAAAAFETALLRQRATAKFSQARHMYFVREALEQASGEIIANHRAARYHGFDHVADLCCGIGGDTLSLARQAFVTAIDLDSLRLAMAQANAAASGVGAQVNFELHDLTVAPPPRADALFFDPARRANGKRVFHLDQYVPAWSHVSQWRRQTPALGVKLAPGISDDDLTTISADEIEFISLDGELKEAVAWFGSLAQAGRRATLLHSQGAPASFHRQHARPGESQADPGAFLYEPDGAIIRAHLVRDLAEQLGAWQLDLSIAYLSADHHAATPFARCWQILAWQPFNLKRLRAQLRDFDAGPVTVKKRGSPLDTDALARQLSGSGSQPLVVVLTKRAGQPIVLVCHGPI